MRPSAPSPTILQVLPALGTGGVERGALEIAQAVIAAGGRAIVASAGGPGVETLRRMGASHVTLGLNRKSPPSIWRNRSALARLIEREGIDLVHARSRAPAWAAIGACRRSGVPLVTTWHGVHHENFPGKKRYNAVLAKGARVIAISAYVAERLTRDYDVGPDRLRLIPRGADVTRFDPAQVSGQRVQALAEAWNLPEDARIIMLPGRLTPWKGQMLMVDALLRLERLIHENWICVLVGPVDPKDKFVRALHKRIRSLGLSDRLRFAGMCKDMPAAYALADVVVTPSLRPEPFGRVAVEAQAMGRPVIASSQGGAMETVLPGETGLLVPPGDAEALARALADVIAAPPDALAWLAERARAHVLAHFTTRRMQHETLAVYDEVLGTSLAARFPLPEETF
ncbi:glycosyltransferase family 4 protein [Acidomonas methanolica]|uniref:Glycosyl transferase n=2 Tax=Acidomonas methanolica TaxID=437 RepID=A0A023D526_ACIMT|nr:glycosyltransferase family 4 protein [Acidomonas methanolica]MBU2653745.1 glycosyltransferase family 4 protein [Acidomonas methanolica]TCS31698.1 glycosyltransferase involved in cell wall biosynthesis [Acidomonas methanolica]GAJ28911.1 glycosyl transferase [Acidomonas methanolica NBRC 104435]GEK98115.1 glycosyl transferase [Acidomonas methanolica NBRC 104435]